MPGPGSVVRTARHRQGLTQEELARSARCGRTLLSRFESGACSVSLATLGRLAIALRLSGRDCAELLRAAAEETSTDA